MNYPLISEYIDAIKAAEDNFDKLANLRPVLDEDGEPVMSSGNFAVVFKMKNSETGKLYAVKCFLKDQEGREEAYRMIADELENVDSPYLTNIKYLEKELFVDTSSSDETEFPVLQMDWVEGETLDKYIRNNINDEYELAMLAYEFSQLAIWLISQPFAHGDLKPDNILVRKDGTIVLVDYDGMYVPAMKGQKARELGSPDFRHPARAEDDFDEHIDDFSLVVILLTLYALSLEPSLLSKYGAQDRLLFSAKDYQNLGESIVYRAIMSLASTASLSSLLSAFMLAYGRNKKFCLYTDLLKVARPDALSYFRADVTDRDLEEAIADEYGVLYSKDGKRLLKCPADVRGEYFIRDGVEVVCNKAFFCCYALKTITIPNSVRNIGVSVFYGCKSLTRMFVEKDNPIYDSRNDCNAIIETSSKTLVAGCSRTVIPDSVKIIGTSAFAGLRLDRITISDSVTIIGASAFEDSDIVTITIPNSVTSIGIGAFSSCFRLSSIKMPDSITSISECAFYRCLALTSIIIPDTVTRIGADVFNGCSRLTTMIIPDSVTNIGADAFKNCSCISSIVIPDSVRDVGQGAFDGCDKLPQAIRQEIGKRFGNSVFDSLLPF